MKYTKLNKSFEKKCQEIIVQVKQSSNYERMFSYNILVVEQNQKIL